MLTITIDALLALKPCDPSTRVALFNGRDQINVEAAFTAGATIRDVLWVLGKTKHKEICVKFAIACAKRVVHLSKSPKSQATIDAAQAWVDAPCEETRKAAYAAADDAAAYAAYATAAYAAYADDAAAYAADDAAATAAYAAYATAAYAAYAADDAAYAAADDAAAYADDAAAYAAYAAADDAAYAAADAAATARKTEQEAQKKILIQLCSED